MLEQINQIDVAPAEALKRLREEREVLEGRVQAMDEMKSEVAESVYLRVRSDYLQRVQQLHDQAKPLLDTARQQFGALRAILDQLQSELDAVGLDRQELELRHKLGEFDNKEFARRVKEIDASVSERQGWHAQATALRGRFLEGVSNETDLTGPPKPAKPAPPPAAPVATPAPAAAQFATPPPPSAPPPPDLGTMVMARPVAPSGNPAADAAMAMSPGSTLLMPAVRLQPAAPPVPAHAAAAPAAAPPVSESTVMFRPARLVPQNPEAGKTTHALALKPVAIGADSGNDIRIGGPGVEPRHAQLNPTPSGYVITDLDTKHGTRVNAERIKERGLANEDVIQIGAARFVFRQ